MKLTKIKVQTNLKHAITKLKTRAHVNSQKYERDLSKFQRGVSKSQGECRQANFKINNNKQRVRLQIHLCGNDHMNSDPNGVLSEAFLQPCATTNSVPQGSVMRPLVSLFFRNDPASVLKLPIVFLTNNAKVGGPTLERTPSAT